jgi:hypothetical protein
MTRLKFVIIAVSIMFITCASIYFSISIEELVVCPKSYTLTPIEVAELADLFRAFINITKNREIQYFAIGGTLIGAVRNGGMLAWDDDIDVGVLMQDVDKIESYSDLVYYFDPCGFGYKFKKRESELFIDIMVYVQDETSKTYRIVNNSFPSEIFLSDELFPLVPMVFSGIEINVASKYKNHLDRAFPEWETKIKIDCGHFGKECTYEKMGTGSTIDITEDSPYMCYVDMSTNTN